MKSSLIAIIFFAILPTIMPIYAQNNWANGEIVGLRAGTCIREGPGYSYRAHTRVPENEWAVMVIDGPRFANGHTWWDTSRYAAGDPSGGTGWVTEDQSDTDCDFQIFPTRVPPNPTPDPETIPKTTAPIFRLLREWWYQQSVLLKWGIALFVVLLAPWHLVGKFIAGFIRAVLLTILIWILLDFTRPLWQAAWLNVGEMIFGANVPDLAALLSIAPLAFWGVSLIRQLTYSR